VSTASSVHEPVDGRTARRDRNRTAVLDAVLELFAEGHFFPSVDEVASRSGVSLRSVYRYVQSTDDLVRAAVERHRELVAHLYAIDRPGHGPLSGRIEVLCTSRVRAHDITCAIGRATRVRAYSNGVLREQLDRARSELAHQVAAQFAPELSALSTTERQSVLAAADALCQFETIELYRHLHGLSTRDTIRCLVAALQRALSS